MRRHSFHQQASKKLEKTKSGAELLPPRVPSCLSINVPRRYHSLTASMRVQKAFRLTSSQEISTVRKYVAAVIRVPKNKNRNLVNTRTETKTSTSAVELAKQVDDIVGLSSLNLHFVQYDDEREEFIFRDKTTGERIFVSMDVEDFTQKFGNYDGDDDFRDAFEVAIASRMTNDERSYAISSTSFGTESGAKVTTVERILTKGKTQK